MKTTYLIDPAHSSVQFSIKHMMIAKVHGSFKKFSGQFIIDHDQQNGGSKGSSVEATIEVNSLDTGDEQRDRHLKSADFFDGEKYPVMTFLSKEITQKRDGLTIKGDLTIHGITKEVLLEVEGPSAEVKDPWGQMRIGAYATTKLKRKDFGLTWNAALEAGGVLVGDDVQVQLDVQLIKQVS